MNIRLKAALLTAGILASAIVSILAFHSIVSVLTRDQILMIVGAGFVGFLVYMLYSITLNRLEYQEALKETLKTIRDQK